VKPRLKYEYKCFENRIDLEDMKRIADDNNERLSCANKIRQLLDYSNSENYYRAQKQARDWLPKHAVLCVVIGAPAWIDAPTQTIGTMI
jgi:hypothetical protein